jgi:hypothetical protein
MRLRKLKTIADHQREAIKADNVIQTLVESTPDQIDGWVDNNVNSLDDAKVLFKRMLKVIAVLARNIEENRNG